MDAPHEERGGATTDEPASTETQHTEPARTHVLTVPLPGFEQDADEHGHFDDCPVCQALRAGDEASATKSMRTHGKRIDVSKLHELDLAPFLAWLGEDGIH
jgi:hypothetical protein